MPEQPVVNWQTEFDVISRSLEGRSRICPELRRLEFGSGFWRWRSSASQIRHSDKRHPQGSSILVGVFVIVYSRIRTTRDMKGDTMSE